MSDFIIRSDFGGPSVPNAYRTELTRITGEMKSVSFAYEMDMMLYVGGDFLEITDPTGVYDAKVSVAKKKAAFAVQMNNKDVLDAADPAGFLRQTIYKALSEMIDKVAAKDKSVNAEDEKQKIAFLR